MSERSGIDGICEVVFDPEGNRLELWDYFRDGDGASAGVAALA